jgi:hypothetical protein
VVSRQYKKYSEIIKLEKKYQKAIRKTDFYTEVKHILEREQPDSVFCAHQRGLKMATIFAAASDLGIPTTTVIFSWDNLPKARLALRASKYYVWSDHMKEEIGFYYPELDPNQVQVTGTPQFSSYKDPQNIIDREIFYRRYGLDPQKRIICFSGDDLITSPDDPKYLRDVANALIESGMDKECQILLRRCPADFSGRFDEVLSDFPNLIREASPLWKRNEGGGWNGIYPTMDDTPLLVSTAYYCDCVLNIGSTMAFDFAQFNKPCLYINYDQPVKIDSDWSTKKLYQFQHFKSMEGLDAVGWINSKSDISLMIQKCIETPSEVGPDRHVWFQKIVAEPASFVNLVEN